MGWRGPRQGPRVNETSVELLPHLLPEPNHELCNLLDIDHVHCILFRLCVDNLCASRDLQRLLLSHHLLVCRQIPEARVCEASVRLFDPSELVDLVGALCFCFFLKKEVQYERSMGRCITCQRYMTWQACACACVNRHCFEMATHADNEDAARMM